jgi:hypothetical protein
MKPSSRPPRTPSKLSDSVHHQLNMYALAASAAGVGVLALPRPAEGKVVYTPAHHVIVRNSHYFLDLNHDGIADFEISQLTGCSTDFCRAYLYVPGLPISGGNYVEGRIKILHSAYALKLGSRIGPKKPFQGWNMYNRTFSPGTAGNCLGSWANVKNRYLGFKFLIKGKTHFGWARLNVSCSGSPARVGLLTGYAYETIPNKPIVAGKTKGADVIRVTEPASLGRLAQGSAGLAASRSGK